MKKYFTTEEIKKDIIKTLRGYSGLYCNLHNEIFNTKCYFTQNSIAIEALYRYGVFNAIGIVQSYEKDTYGEVYTDLYVPTKLANMLYYILGEDFMFGGDEFGKILNEHWDETANDETNEQLIEALELE